MTGIMQDREIWVQPHEVIRSAWIDIDLVVLGCRDPMAGGDIERAMNKLLQQGQCQSWPPPRGWWREDGRFVLMDGRHEYLASLARGRETLFVAWRSLNTTKTEQTA